MRDQGEQRKDQNEGARREPDQVHIVGAHKGFVRDLIGVAVKHKGAVEAIGKDETSEAARQSAAIAEPAGEMNAQEEKEEEKEEEEKERRDREGRMQTQGKRDGRRNGERDRRDENPDKPHGPRHGTRQRRAHTAPCHTTPRHATPRTQWKRWTAATQRGRSRSKTD